jgi:hypothetical protein
MIALCLHVAGCGVWDDLFGSDRKASIDPGAHARPAL